MKAWLSRLMYGRYGQDDLNKYLTIFDLYRLPDVFAKRSEQSGGKYGVFKREE
jgi:hypothetical protein